MRISVHVLMLFAWLAYGLMPAFADPTCGRASPPVVAHAMHSSPNAEAAPADHDGPCSHCKGMSHTGTCPGCVVTLPAGYAIHGDGPVGYPVPALDTVPAATASAPPTPPPRV